MAFRTSTRYGRCWRRPTPRRYSRKQRERLEALLSFCEATGCRRQVLLRYFGEEHEGNCGNCDNCLQPPKTWDATEPARKALSCVYRTGQRFGAAHVTDVLMGKTNDRLSRLRHDQLSTFGIGADLSKPAWHSILRQLLAHGHLQSDPEGHGGLQLAPRCRELLRGEQSLELREDILPSSSKRKASSGTGRKAPPDVPDGPHWERLRQFRKELADAEGVPPPTSSSTMPHSRKCSTPGLGPWNRWANCPVLATQSWSGMGNSS